MLSNLGRFGARHVSRVVTRPSGVRHLMGGVSFTHARRVAPVVSQSFNRWFSFTSREVGSQESLEWRMFLDKKKHPKSFWHDVPLFADESEALYNYINEIPRGSRAKNEIATKERLNPIKQDTKKGKLRFFKYGDIPFNYGCFPQTYEDPNKVHPDTGMLGDNDPIDVCEISGSPMGLGEIAPVKILGLFGLIDEGETDWKIIAISNKHKLASKLNDIKDVNTHMPGTLDTILDWFRNYKVPDGKPRNRFSHGEEAQPREYATKIVHETNESWKDLKAGKIDAGGLVLTARRTIS